MNENLKFEDLPRLVNQLSIEISELKELVLKLTTENKQVKEWLTAKEAAEFMLISKNTLDKKVQSCEFPHRLRNNKLVFKRSELEYFMETGKFPEFEENKNMAYEHMVSKFSKS
ncbi:MAG: helix-turn-helix transcriptional regulator [Psychroflexus sp.]